MMCREGSKVGCHVVALSSALASLASALDRLNSSPTEQPQPSISESGVQKVRMYRRVSIGKSHDQGRPKSRHFSRWRVSPATHAMLPRIQKYSSHSHEAKSERLPRGRKVKNLQRTSGEERTVRTELFLIALFSFWIALNPRN